MVGLHRCDNSGMLLPCFVNSRPQVLVRRARRAVQLRQLELVLRIDRAQSLVARIQVRYGRGVLLACGCDGCIQLPVRAVRRRLQHGHGDVGLLPRRLQILEMLVQLRDLVVVVCARSLNTAAEVAVVETKRAVAAATVAVAAVETSLPRPSPY